MSRNATVDGGEVQGIDVRDGGRLLVTRSAQSSVSALGVHTGRDGITLSGRVLRDLPDRRNVFVESRNGSSSCYLKVLKDGKRGSVPRPGSREAERRFGAVREFLTLHRLADSGFRVPRPVASGLDERSGESFVLAEEIRDARLLDGWIESVDPRVDRAEIRRVGESLADLLRALHERAFFHRDFYLCHVMSAEAGEDLVLLDVERMLIRPWRRARWRIKDLAALSSSAPRGKISRPDRLRFLLRYLGADRPSRSEFRRLVARIARKEAKILRHVPRKDRPQRSEG